MNIYKMIEKTVVSAVFVSSILSFSACTSDFERINKNPLNPDKAMEAKDGVIVGMYLPDLQKTVIPTGNASDGTTYVNIYQVTQNMTGDSWIGYLAPTQDKFDGGQSFVNYFFADWRRNGVFNDMFTKVFTPWIQIKKSSMDGPVKRPEIYSMAQIAKIAALSRAADMFGAIPYTEVGSGNFKVKYNSQREVYEFFLKELEEASEILYTFGTSNPLLLPDFDAVYEGNVHKWAKFANTLMLRLAIRVRYADEELARTYAEKAVNSPAGLIENVADIAQLSKGAGIDFRNSLKDIWDNYGDTKMGATIYTFLAGYDDPRINVYFKPSKYSGGKQFNAVRSGKNPTYVYKDFSVPNIDYSTPTYWMKASESFFLRAEGALAGWNMKGTAKEFYEKGIRKSFEENKVEGVDAYLANTNTPARYNDPLHGELSTNAPSTITVKWEESDSEETKLERIITQKYLAGFPNGIEAWTEWRRTGYPVVIPVVENNSNYGATTGDGKTGGVRRMPYPKSEYDNNLANVKEAVNNFYGGKDDAATNVWWDKKNK